MEREKAMKISWKAYMSIVYKPPRQKNRLNAC